MKRILWAAVSASLVFNAVLLLASTTNAHWVLSHVAGGQYKSLPLGIRFSNFIVALFSLYLIYFSHLLVERNGSWSRRVLMLSRAVTILFVLSTIVNGMSRSANERWNAIPALVIAIGIYRLSGKDIPLH